MYQYFCDEPLEIGKEYIFTKEQAHHAKVIRLAHETIRLVSGTQAFFAEGYEKDGFFYALVKEKDSSDHELREDLTLAFALIRREKMELIIQKATELGVKKIIPFESSRCVVHAKKEKMSKQQERWQEIAKEAARQCKRNIIPEVTEVIAFKDLKEMHTDLRAAAYENAYGKAPYLSEIFQKKHSMAVVIGPEGGFSEEEMQNLQEWNYIPVTFGERILRAETAAMYACAVFSECSERRGQ